MIKKFLQRILAKHGYSISRNQTGEEGLYFHRDFMEDKKALFTEGGRGKDSLATNVDSTGYGLYIAKQIVLEHKGAIWAESEGRDKGSEFIVELPKK